jgi:Predicted membrane protein (DUF2339)
MSENNNQKINLLLEKLESLSIKQSEFSKEINTLRSEIAQISNKEIKAAFPESSLKIEQVEHVAAEQLNPTIISEKNEAKGFATSFTAPFEKALPKVKTDFERFIGENLLNKIGILITVIGVAIGAKYSIEHQLISPLTRIVLGYLMGLGLLGFGIKLKANYENYSAVLVSGAIAIMYFITYAAYSFYGLFPQGVAFGLMLVFTAFSVVAAINYNKQIIAHIGLVGAYAVPFLLSEGSGKVVILFSYMAIINVGILIISIKKYWKPLYYSSFALTWVIYISWYVSKYQTEQHFNLALLYASIFFVIFYVILLAYKLIQKEKFDTTDIALLLANSFVFYGLGYSILSSHPLGIQYLGLFTVANALIHFGVSSVIYKQDLADKNLFYLIAGLVLVFITIAVPVQLDGNWVTLLWAFEAALLFWIGRAKGVSLYEKLSYPLMILAFLSIGQDLLGNYGNYMPQDIKTKITPLLNINFLSSVLFLVAFAFINYVNNKNKLEESIFKTKDNERLTQSLIPLIFLVILYFSFFVEISNYWNQLYEDSQFEVSKIKDGNYYSGNNDLLKFKSLWLINYSLAFFSILSIINFRKIKNKTLGYANLGLLGFFVLYFLTVGLYDLSELRESYLGLNTPKLFRASMFGILFRYISCTFMGFTLFRIYKYLSQDFILPITQNAKKIFELFLSSCILWLASSELINWMDIGKFSQSYKLGLSILWGIFSLSLISIGIWKNKKHLRIAAIALFGITLLKLFIYDISHLDTIAKTIVFVALGLLLLLISFLYNKYKHLIIDENEIKE